MGAGAGPSAYHWSARESGVAALPQPRTHVHMSRHLYKQPLEEVTSLSNPVKKWRHHGFPPGWWLTSQSATLTGGWTMKLRKQWGAVKCCIYDLLACAAANTNRERMRKWETRTPWRIEDHKNPDCPMQLCFVRHSTKWEISRAAIMAYHVLPLVHIW